MDWITDPNALVGLLTLTALEVVLGIDNIIFISILSSKLPKTEQPRARRLGLGGAFVTRILLLLSIAWIVRLTTPLFKFVGIDFTGRSLILLVGGLFLIAKATFEIHGKLEGSDEEADGKKAASSLVAVVAQIMVIDIVFSLDSVITAVGMVSEVQIMIAANVVALRDHARRGHADQRLRRPSPDDQDARAVVPGADRHEPGRRRARAPHPEGLHLLRDVLLIPGGDAEPATPRKAGRGAAA